MNASRVLCLSSRLTRWASLLALSVLPLAAGACIAQTGSPEGPGSGAKDEHPAAAATGTINETSNPSLKGTQTNSPGSPGPVLGPIPSPWGPQPTSGDPTADPNANGGPGDEPLPSPWMDEGTTTTTTSTTSSSSPPAPSGH